MAHRLMAWEGMAIHTDQAMAQAMVRVIAVHTVVWAWGAMEADTAVDMVADMALMGPTVV